MSNSSDPTTTTRAVPTGNDSRSLRAELVSLDEALYRAVADTPTPKVDEPLRRLSNAANNSGLWLATAAGLAVLGGRAGRQAALTGVSAIGVASAVTNLGVKRLYLRRRPDRQSASVKEARQVKMPESTSFPSGHSASAFAFATAVTDRMPLVGVPLLGLAGTVAYSRVHTGVHYPGDVVVGSILGVSMGSLTARAVRLVERRFRDPVTA
ncbi:MAG: phosphatase PAP2 family protein [Actinomycetia bacterium]|nr:phosphatase PAP2 family protein [Actinomycetes bacterium]